MTSTDGVVNISSDDSSDLKPSENLLCTYPPGANRGGVSIKSSDLFCLEDEEWLTDQIISKGVNYFCIIINYVLDFQMTILLHRLPAKRRKDVMIFSSYFYEKLIDSSSSSIPKSLKKEIQHKRVA